MDNTEYLRLKEIVEEHLIDLLPEIDPKSAVLGESMKYSLTAGGKRLRPVLLLASCNFCGGSEPMALPYACAVEFIHTYSLIHDDLPAMDDDDLRRGVATNHKVYGDAIAILAGDGLQSAAFEVMLKDMLMYFDDPAQLKQRVKAALEICKGSGCRGMIAGQVSDIEAENRQCSLEMLDYIHLNKTASLITSAVRAGAYLADADSKVLDDLTTYGECLGLAFQIADDILDATGTVEKMGKKPRADIENNKSTYVAIYGLENARDRFHNLTETAKHALADYYDEAEFFIQLAEELAGRSC